jgi:hypothetical protein
MSQFIFGIFKSFIFLIVLQACALSANIVYVYLSPQLPPYIYVALEQARLFNPNTNIYLISNQQAIDRDTTSFIKHNIIAIPAESLSPSTSHLQFNNTSTLDTESRGGLWRKSTERFFYIQELIALYNLKSVVHVEGDVMLYMNVSEMQNAFSHYKGIGAVFDCDYRCIPSIVYIANEKAINHLVAFITANAYRGLFDMHILAEYRNTFSNEYVDNLPLIMPEYLINRTLINDLNQTPRNPAAYINNIDLFDSIFDGAAIGQYLGGIDPRNGHSQPGFINETCIFNPYHLTFEWQKDEQERNIPYAICNDTRYRINNLHIHSKFLEMFKS